MTKSSKLILLSFSFFLLLATTISAQKEIEVAPHPENGVDAFPVYKSLQDNSYIDSIIYTKKFIIFCVSFEKPITEKTYHLEAVNSKHSWMAHNGVGHRKPLLIRNVRRNGTLMADYVRDKPLSIPLRSKDKRQTAHISCQFQFWRGDFQHNRAEIIKDLETTKKSNEMELLFNSIRLRTSNYTHSLSPALAAYYDKDYKWSTPQELKDVQITINEQPIKPSWNNVSNSVTSTSSHPVIYEVTKKNENKLFIEDIQHTSTSTIFKVSVCGYRWHSMYLYNTKKEGFFVQIGKKKNPAQAIKNIRINKVLVLEELKKGEHIKFDHKEASFLLTFELHFEQLPKDLEPFNLVEVFKENKTSTPFSFYNITKIVE